MIYKILLPLLFITTSLFSQTHRFIYQYQYKLDSTKPDYQKEEMVLDVNPKDVKFYEYGFLVKDSLNILRGNTNDQYTSQSEQTLSRKLNSFKNQNYLQIWMMDFYYVLESNDEIKWNITNETKTENGFKQQKATTNMFGRKWTAWFTPDIPISEGPYKFRGLPGLILSIEDSQKNFIYKLSRNKNLAKTFDTNRFVENHYQMKALPINWVTWVKLKKEFYNDPYARMRRDFQPDWDVEINGRKVKSKDDFYEMNADMQKTIKAHYQNPLELDKAIIL